MIRRALGGLLVAAGLAAPVAAGEKADPKLTSDAKDGIQVTQENITRMKFKKAMRPVVGGPPLTPSLPVPPSAPAAN